MIYNTRSFPILATKRIVISKDLDYTPESTTTIEGTREVTRVVPNDNSSSSPGLGQLTDPMFGAGSIRLQGPITTYNEPTGQNLEGGNPYNRNTGIKGSVTDFSTGEVIIFGATGQNLEGGNPYNRNTGIKTGNPRTAGIVTSVSPTGQNLERGNPYNRNTGIKTGTSTTETIITSFSATGQNLERGNPYNPNTGIKGADVNQGGSVPVRLETTTESYTETIVSPAINREFTKVKVEFLLKTRENRSISKWFSEEYQNNPIVSEYAEYLRVYFYVIDDSAEGTINWLQDPQTRYATLQNLPNIASLRGRPFNMKMSSITFSEILQNEHYTSTPVSDLSGDYYHDIYSELEIDLEGLDLESTSKLHLIGFIHMDVHRYAEDTGIVPTPSSPLPIQSIGGDLIYDLLLERSYEYGEKLEIPFYRQALYIETSVNSQNFEGDQISRTDLEAYYGPAHYHGEDSPGPGGYVGWMAGYGAHLMSGPYENPEELMGPRLTGVTIRNYKVVSSVYNIEEKASPFSLERFGSDPSQSSGNMLDLYLNSILNQDEILDERTKILELVKASSYAESKTKKNFMKSTDYPMTSINSVSSADPDTGRITNETSHYSSVVGLDYFRLVRDLSNYGNILNFHHDKENRSMVSSLLAGSKILNIDVLRERVTNNPYSFNDTDSRDYKVYDVNEPSKKLVNAKDVFLRFIRPGQSLPAYQGNLIPTTTDLATLREIDLATLDPGSGITIRPKGYNRFFHIKDYDLFHNVQNGKYRYKLKITLLDGIYISINKILNSLKGSYYFLTNFLNIASQPVIRDSSGAYVQGNYDYNVSDFHANFKDIDISSEIRDIIKSYSRAAEFLSGEKPLTSETMYIECSLEPSSTNLENINHICNTFNSLITTVSDMLKLNGDNINFEDLKKSGNTHVPSSGVASKSRTIEVTVKCPDIVEAISDGTLVANYSSYQLEDEQGNDITPDLPNLGLQDFLDRISRPTNYGRINLGTGRILPSSYNFLQSSPYTTSQYITYPHTNSPARGSNINVTKPVSTITRGSKIMSSYQSFIASPAKLKNTKGLILNSMRALESVSTGFSQKPLSSMFYKSFERAGVTIDLLGEGLNLGTSTSDSEAKKKQSDAKRKLKDAHEKADKDNCIELTDELKDSIEDAAGTSSTRPEATPNPDREYGNINIIVNTLGSMYDELVPVLGSLANPDGGKITILPDNNLNEEVEFTGEENTADPIGPGVRLYETYIQEAAEMKVVSFDASANLEKLKTDAFDSTTSNTAEIGTYVFLKAVTDKKEDAIRPVNDGILLRI